MTVQCVDTPTHLLVQSVADVVFLLIRKVRAFGSSASSIVPVVEGASPTTSKMEGGQFEEGTPCAFLPVSSHAPSLPPDGEQVISPRLPSSSLLFSFLSFPQLQQRETKLNLTTMILVFLQAWDGVIQPRLARFWTWLRAPQPVPDPTPGGHAPDPVAAIENINRALLRQERGLQQLLVELHGIRNEQPTQQSQRVLLRRLAAALKTAAADPVPESETQ